MNRKRKFLYITVGEVLGKINQMLGENFKRINPRSDENSPELTRSTYYRIERRLGLPTSRTSGGWRVYSSKEEQEILEKIKKEFRIK